MPASKEISHWRREITYKCLEGHEVKCLVILSLDGTVGSVHIC